MVLFILKSGIQEHVLLDDLDEIICEMFLVCQGFYFKSF